MIHCTAGKDRTGFACALILHALGVPDELIAEDYLLTNRFYRRDPASASDLPDDVRQVLGSVETSFLAAAFDAISADYGDLESYFSDGLGGRCRSTRRLKALPGILKSLDVRVVGLERRLRRGFHFCIEVGDDVLERRDRLLNRGDLHQLPAADRAVALLQRDNQIPPLLLELNKR